MDTIGLISDYLCNKIDRYFYSNPPEIVANTLIGKTLIYIDNHNNIFGGIIVETEAYLSENDFSSHSALGKTKRNEAMFLDGGHLYVYKIYGVHHCINVVTEEINKGSAVLIRSLIPVLGIDKMIENRGLKDIKKLCKGPGNICKSLGFTLQNDKYSLISDNLFISNYNLIENPKISISRRIGISKSADLQLRFFLSDCDYISGKKSDNIAILNPL